MKPDVRRLIYDIYVLLDAAEADILQSFGLTPSQYRLLSLLETSDGEKLVTLSEHLLVNRSTVSRLMTALQEMGLVECLPDPDDGRAYQVVLTTAGDDLYNQAQQSITDTLRQKTEPIITSSLVDRLQKLRHALSGEDR